MGFPTKKRTFYLFNPRSDAPFTISRTKIETFTQCPRCLYLDSRRGVPRPKGPPFALNSAVDTLLKKEFDLHRAKHTSHPLMKAYGIEAVPFEHEKMEEWRDALKRGVSTLHEPTNFIVRGGVDDVWQGKNGELIVVDYKATSKEGKITLDDEWKVQYKRQLEIYQWLFRRNGFKVSDTGYFVYVNGKTDRKSFDGKLEFDVAVIPYVGSDDWIEDTLHAMKKCLMSDEIPVGDPNCEYCSYFDLVQNELASQNSRATSTNIRNKDSDIAETVKRFEVVEVKTAKKKSSAKSKPKGADANQNLF